MPASGHEDTVMRKAWEALASLEAFLALSAILAGTLAVGAFREEVSYAHPVFAGLVSLWALNLAACTIRKGSRLPRAVLLVHLAVLLVVAGGATTGLAGKRGRMSLRAGEPATATVLDREGNPAFDLPFAVRLDDFRVEYDRDPVHRLSLRHPKEDWHRTLEVLPGSVHPVPGTRWSLAVGRFIPDLVVGAKGIEKRSDEPRNPALQVAFLEEGEPRGGAWLFARFPGLHQEELPLEAEYVYEPAPVGQYVSRVTLLDASAKEVRAGEVKVNHPLRHGGFTLYQAAYDPRDGKASVLEAARDPGVPVVYAGFILLMIGLTLHLFRRRP